MSEETIIVGLLWITLVMLVDVASDTKLFWGKVNHTRGLILRLVLLYVGYLIFVEFDYKVVRLDVVLLIGSYYWLAFDQLVLVFRRLPHDYVGKTAFLDRLARRLWPTNTWTKYIMVKIVVFIGSLVWLVLT